MPKKITPPTTLRQAFELTDYILCYARDKRLEALSTDKYADEAAKLQLLASVGAITATRWELEPLVLDVDSLRLFCSRSKPATDRATQNALNVPALSQVAAQTVARLTDLAADTPHSQHAAQAAALIGRLPTTLNQVRALAGVGADLKQCAKWLK